MSELFKVLRIDWTPSVVISHNDDAGICHDYIGLDNHMYDGEFAAWMDYVLDFGICMELAVPSRYERDRVIMVILMEEWF